MPDDGLSDPDLLGRIVIRRRNVFQDTARSYTVFIDEVVVGKIWAFQTKVFTVTPGSHELQLKIVNTGRSCSDVFQIEVAPKGTLVFKTHFRGLKNTLMLPLAMPEARRAFARGEQLHSKYYEWPWIRMRLEE